MNSSKDSKTVKTTKTIHKNTISNFYNTSELDILDPLLNNQCKVHKIS